MSVAGNFLVSASVGIMPVAIAYRNTHLPITQQDSSGSRFRVCRNDLVENMAVGEVFAAFLKKTGIREDVFFGEQVVEQTGLIQDLGYYGANSFRGGPAGVNLWRHLFLWDPDACRGMIKHELGHIKHNDAVRGPLMDCVIYTAGLFFGSCCTFFEGTSLMTVIAQNLITGSLSLLSIRVGKMFSARYQESQADEFAVRESSIDELKGFRRFLVVAQRLQEVAWSVDGFFSKIWHYDWQHPSPASRINRVNQELRVRLASIDEDEELVKEKRLTYFLLLAVTHQPTDTIREPSAADERVLENLWRRTP